MRDFSREIVSLNRRGYLIGPTENLHIFFNRVKELQKDAPELPTVVPNFLKEIFDINPEYVRIIYSNEGIGVWEGACTWIAENEVAIQLRKSLKKKSRIFFLYSKDELISHEMVHVARAKFFEKEFEEILAYSTSRSQFRKFLGPIFRNPGEAYICILGLLLFVVLLCFQPLLSVVCLAATLIFFVGRLIRLQLIFLKARDRIKRFFGINPYALLLRLTDREIKLFASGSEKEIVRYIDLEREKNERWKQIYLSYFI